MNPQTTPVLVVGAGPTGLALAIELLRHNVACRLIDKLSEPARIAKASGIMPRTMEVFEAMGVIDDFLERGLHLQGFSAYKDDSSELLAASFGLVDSPYNFVLGLEQYQTERLLRARLEELGGAVERGVTLVEFEDAGDVVRATLERDGETEACEFAYVAGCDGAHSTVRHQLNLSFDGAAYPQDFILGHMRMKWPVPRDQMCLYLTDEGSLFATPLPEGERWIVAADLNGPQKDLVHDGDPTIEDLQTVIDGRAPDGTVASDAVWTSFFRVHHRQVNLYGSGRVFVCGDAAHIHTPLGGQGMNTGIQDAYNLGWKLALVVKGLARDSLLHSYHPERWPVGREVLKSTNELQVASSWRNPVLRHMRNTVMHAAGHLEITRHMMMEEMGETAYSYHRGPLAHEHLDGGVHLHRDPRHPAFADVRAFHDGPRSGDRAPDAADEHVRLFDHLGSTRFKLLLFEGTHASDADAADLSRVADDVRDKLGDLVEVTTISPASNPAGGPTMLADPKQTIHHRYGARGQCQVLVRPDGYIGFRSQPVDAARLVRYFESVGIG